MNLLFKKITETQTAESGYHYAVLDFDNTCIINDIGEAVFHYLCEHKLLRNPLLLEGYSGSASDYHEAVFKHYYALTESSDRTQCCAFAAQCLSGFSISEIPDLVKKVLTIEGSFISKQTLFGLDVNKGIIQQAHTNKLYEYAAKHNIDVWIVSASSRYIVQAAMQELFPEFNVRIIGVENNNKDGIIGSEITLPMSARKGKLTHIITDIHKDIRPLFVVGDSMNDFAMLNYAQVPIVVYRGNELSEHAKEHGWFILKK